MRSKKSYDTGGCMSANLNEQVIIEESDDQYINTDDSDLLDGKNPKLRNASNFSI